MIVSARPVSKVEEREVVEEEAKLSEDVVDESVDDRVVLENRESLNVDIRTGRVS
jgi:hypothetical protein